MLLNNFLIIIFSICISASCSQENNFVEGNIAGIGQSKVFLYSYADNKINLVDSAYSKNDIFVFNLSDSVVPGMYHIRWGKNPQDGIDIILNSEKFKLYAHRDSVPKTLVFENSPENDLFYSFYPLRLVIQQLTKHAEMLNKTDPIGNRKELLSLNQHLDSLEYNVSHLLDELSDNSKQLLSYKILKTAFLPNYDYYLKKGKTEKIDPYLFMQRHFFENIDFNEPLLIHTPFLFDAVEKYLSLYVHPRNIEQFKKACDFIISKAAVNEQMYDYIVNLLVRTFEKSDFWEVYLYLMEMYYPQVCSDQNAYSDEKLLFEIVKNSRPGSVAKDLNGITADGKIFSLQKDIHAKVVLLLFWSTDCPYCEELIHQLSDLVSEYDRTELKIVTFCLTKNKDEWTEAIKKNNMLKWINISDLKDKESPAFEKYHIRGTPEMYIITEDFHIFSRPVYLSELHNNLSSLLK